MSSRFERVCGDLHVLRVPFGNVWTAVVLAGSKEGGCVLIDSANCAERVDDTIVPALEKMGLSLSDVRYLLCTHTHGDHFFPDDFFARTAVAALMKEEKPFFFYATPLGIEKLRQAPSTAKIEEEGRLIVKELTPFVTVVADGYKITPLEAYHCPEAVIYLIEKDGKAMLYANDTGYFPDSTWEYLKARQVKLDLISYDCTYGIWDRGRVTHMHLPLCIEVRERLRSEGLLKEGAKHLLTHFSHRDGSCGYEIFAPIAEKEGFTVAYDGLVVEF